MRLLPQDVRYAFRSLCQKPGFALVCVLTLALGIGANTAVYSVLYGVWLAPAQYSGPGDLFDIEFRQLTGNRFPQGVSPAILKSWKDLSSTVADFSAHRYISQVNVTGKEGAEEVVAHRIAANLLDVLGVHPAAGTPFDATADTEVGPTQALLSAEWCRSRFGGDIAAATGKRLEVNGQTYTITGIMPDDFQFPPLSSDQYRPVLWLSLNLSHATEIDRKSKALSVIGRTRAGSPAAAVRDELEGITARLEFAETKDLGVTVEPLNEGRALNGMRPILSLAMAAALAVLLIAAANIATLLLARGVSREREIAVRRALGVTWSRLARQLLTESAVLCVIGGAAGVAAAYVALPVLKSQLPANMPRVDEVAIRFPVLLFACAVTMVTGLLVSLIPLWHARGDLSVRTSAHAHGRSRASRRLLAGEIALAVILTASAGLLLASFQKVSNVDLGFDPARSLTVRIPLAKARYPDASRIRAFREELLRQVYALPGVRYAGTISSLPMGIIAQGTDFTIEGRPDSATASAFFSNVSSDYMRAMEIPLIAGRYFQQSDGPGSERVAIVSEALARRWWTDNGLGQRIRFDNTWFTIVGVVRDVRQYTPEQPSEPQIYALNDQLPIESQGRDMGRFNILVARGSQVQAIAIRRIVERIDPHQPVSAVATMEQVVSSHLQTRRMNTTIATLFGVIALLLAASGIYGVVSHAVERRTREFGIRSALGATPWITLRQIGSETLVTAAVGVAIGWVGVTALSRWMASFLFGVEPLDPLILASTGLVLTAVALAATWMASRRAMYTDPMTALRTD
ncbi:MAG: ABC transporter permease [Acidobacteria bacterium]|nr:ABC transporter permease [Acidobacteriota bacterium]